MTATAPSQAKSTGDVPVGIRMVAERARQVFGKDAPAVLRRWTENDGDRRWTIAAELLEGEARPPATSCSDPRD